MKKRIVYFAVILLAILITSCKPATENRNYRLAISKANPEKSYHYYNDWIHNVDSTIVCIDMYGMGIDSALLVLQGCDGLLVTGGEDIDPNYYNEVIDSMRCDLPNAYRDSLDFALIESALKKGLPIMAICRGLQLVNVSFGGSLYFDIPTDMDTLVKHRYPDYKPSEHSVTIQEGSLLKNISGVFEGNTYSNHHQGIKHLGDMLKASAYTEDGLIEAIELSDGAKKPFLLGVQWHPERMDITNPLSANIATSFVEALKK